MRETTENNHKDKRTIASIIIDSKYSFAASVIALFISFMFFSIFSTTQTMTNVFQMLGGELATSKGFANVMFAVGLFITSIIMQLLFEVVMFVVYRSATRIVRTKEKRLFTIQMYVDYFDFSKAVRFTFVLRNLILGILYLFLFTNPLLISLFTVPVRFVITSGVLILSFFVLKRKFPQAIAHLAFERIAKAYLFFMVIEFFIVVSPLSGIF